MFSSLCSCSCSLSDNVLGDGHPPQHRHPQQDVVLRPRHARCRSTEPLSGSQTCSTTSPCPEEPVRADGNAAVGLGKSPGLPAAEQGGCQTKASRCGWTRAANATWMGRKQDKAPDALSLHSTPPLGSSWVKPFNLNQFLLGNARLGSV